MAIQIDLRAPTISSTARCWRLFPGASYKFLEIFTQNDVAFLDIPGFVMPEGRLIDDPELPQRLRVSEIVLEKISRDGIGVVPEVSDAEILGFRVGKRRQRNQQAVVNFFDVAERGDLVVMPEPFFHGHVNIGIFRDQKHHSVGATAPNQYGPVPIPARRVRWLRRVRENQLSSPLSDSLRNQHPFSLLERSTFIEIMSHAYESFIFGDHHSSMVFNRKDDYIDRDSALIAIVSQLAATYTEAFDSNNFEKIALLDALFSEASIEYRCSQSIDIHSPGFNRFVSSARTPLVIAAMMAALAILSSCNSDAEIPQMIDQIVYVNNSDQADPECTAMVSAVADMALRSMDTPHLWRLCQEMKDAQARAGLESSAVPAN